MVLIGTAGHVDHGKSTLVEALTGINPMHLPEEKRRELTIELGFAHLEHPDGFTLSIVDVPGHEKLVKTMVSGATSFQVALWVVDAREGLMPQSLEHLDVLELLGAATVVPVVTKADLASENQIRETTFAIERELERVSIPSCPVHIVDSISQRGISQLKETIFSLCRRVVADSSRTEALCYMPIDRAFLLKGVGAVVTGTLARGRLVRGASVSISARGESWRIRTLHNHSKEVESVTAGQRVGVHLHGIRLDEIQRGDILVSPDYPYHTRCFNVELRFLNTTAFRWKPGLRALFLAASFEMECRIWGLVRSESGIRAQIQIPEEVCFYRGQRFILRSTNPLQTIGGGTVLDIVPDRKRRVNESELTVYSGGFVEAGLADYVRSLKRGIVEAARLETKWMFRKDEAVALAMRNPDLRTVQGRIGGREEGLIWHTAHERFVLDRLKLLLDSTRGKEKECSFQDLEVKFRVPTSCLKVFLDVVLASEAFAAVRTLVSVGPNTVRLNPRQAGLSPSEAGIAGELLRRLKADGLSPARVKDYVAAGVDQKTFDRVLASLLKDGLVVRVDNEFVLERQQWEDFKTKVGQIPSAGFTPSEFGKHFGLSRKYTMPYLECLNRLGVLRRQGDKHVVRR